MSALKPNPFLHKNILAILDNKIQSHFREYTVNTVFSSFVKIEVYDGYMCIVIREANIKSEYINKADGISEVIFEHVIEIIENLLTNNERDFINKVVYLLPNDILGFSRIIEF